MADFSKFGIAVEKALQWPDGSFLKAYRNNRAEAVAVALAESLLPPLLEKIIQDSPEQIWDGTATELLTALNLIADQATRASKEWPGKPQALAKKLQRLAPDLAASGIRLRSYRDGSKKNNRMIELSLRKEQEADQASESSDASEASASSDASEASDDPSPLCS